MAGKFRLDNKKLQKIFRGSDMKSSMKCTACLLTVAKHLCQDLREEYLWRVAEKFGLESFIGCDDSPDFLLFHQLLCNRKFCFS